MYSKKKAQEKGRKKEEKREKKHAENEACVCFGNAIVSLTLSFRMFATMDVASVLDWNSLCKNVD